MQVHSRKFSFKALRQQSLRTLDRVVDTVKEPVDRFLDSNAGMVVTDGLLGALPGFGAGSNAYQLINSNRDVDLDLRGITRTTLAFTGVSASLLSSVAMSGGHIGTGLIYAAISGGTAVINSVSKNVFDWY